MKWTLPFWQFSLDQTSHVNVSPAAKLTGGALMFFAHIVESDVHKLSTKSMLNNSGSVHKLPHESLNKYVHG